MNPFQAIMGASAPSAPQAGQSAMPTMNAGFGGIMGRVQQLANMFRDPQQMVQQVFPDAPAEVQGDPNRMLAWMQQTGKVNPQMVQMAQQMMGRR